MTETFGFLISDTSRLLARRFDERARSHGATRAQWKALAYIGRNEGLHQGRLAEMLEVEPITLCRMVDRLEEAGFVERRRDPADRRAWQLFLTDRATPVLEQMREIADEMTRQALAGLSEATIANLTNALNTIRANLADSEDSRNVAHG